MRIPSEEPAFLPEDWGSRGAGTEVAGKEKFWEPRRPRGVGALAWRETCLLCLGFLPDGVAGMLALLLSGLEQT